MNQTIKRIEQNLSGKLWALHRILDRSWDETHGVETSKILGVDELDIDSENTDFESDSLIYVPTPTRAVHRAVTVLDLPLEEFVFIDYGSGKGRAVLGASEYPFRRIEGVEFARDLHEVAVQNLAAYRSSTQQCHDVVVKHGDAVEYDIPDEPCFFYMYNTFEPRVLRLVMQSIERSYRANPRPMVMVYLFPQFKEVVAEFSFMHSRRGRRSPGIPMPHGLTAYVTPEAEAMHDRHARRRRGERVAAAR